MRPRPCTGIRVIGLAFGLAGCLASGSVAGDLSILNAKAQRHFQMKELPEACALWRQAVRHDPRSVMSYVKLGTALTQLRKFREAEGVFRQALKVEPDNAMVHYHLGALFLHEDRREPARASLERALRHTPWYPNARYLLGYIDELEGRYEDAARQYVAELNVNPPNQDAMYHLLNLQKQGKFGRNWDRKVEWTPRKIVGVSIAMTIGLGLFVLAQVKTHTRSGIEDASTGIE